MLCIGLIYHTHTRTHTTNHHRSPVLSALSEAISGATTIRAFGVSPWLVARTRALVDANGAATLLGQSLNRCAAAE